MSRVAAQAVGGYYATPPELLPSIAALLRCDTTESYFSFADPCTGDGAAIFTLAELCAPDVLEPNSHNPAKPSRSRRARVYACELEQTRYKALEQRRWRFGAEYAEVAHGDAFRLRPQSKRASVVFLNPPYDPDREMARVEERWLRRFGPLVRDGGALVFVVPFYALVASAVTLALAFEDLHCFRFPGAFFDAFKQVVLVARRRLPRMGPDAAIEAQVREWAADPSSIPELPTSGPAVLDVPGEESSSDTRLGYDAWKVEPLDVSALFAEHRPWTSTNRTGRAVPVANVVPDDPFDGLLAPTFQLGTVPRPAHLAAGLAAGVLSGVQLRPNDRASGLPDILVRGVFRKRFLTTEEKVNRDGDVTALVQAQVPELTLVALDLRAGEYHTLGNSTDVTGARSVGAMTAGDLLASYSRDLLAALRERCPAQYDPTRPGDVWALPSIGGRTMFEAQEHATRALVRLLGQGDRTAVLLGEIGTGKTTVSLRALQARGARRVLVLLPPHVVTGFAAQVQDIWPGARVVVLEDVAGVDALMTDRDEKPIVALLSREAAKLGHAWAGVEGSRCSACGTRFKSSPEELAKSRVFCSARPVEPRKLRDETGAEYEHALGRWTIRLAEALAWAAPNDANVGAIIPRRVRDHLAEHLSDARAAWPAAQTRLRSLVEPLVAAISGRHHHRTGWLPLLLHLLLAIDDEMVTAWAARALYGAARGEESTTRDMARSVALLLPPNGATQKALVAELRSIGIDDEPKWRSFDSYVHALAIGTGWVPDEMKVIEGSVHIGKVGHGIGAACHALSIAVDLGFVMRGKECGEPLHQAVPQPRRYPLAHYIAKRYRAQARREWALIVDEGHEYAGSHSAQALASQQLLGLRMPTIVMTGSVMNGYAASLFSLLWWTSSAFRAEFDQHDRTEFVRRYGYVKQIVELKDENGQKVTFGAVTDRVETTARESGQAPGVLPTLLLRHLLPIAVTLQMSDIAKELPSAHEIPVFVRAEGDLFERYSTLERRLVDQMKRDRFEPDLSGRLFGQLAQLPAALDRLTRDVCGSDYVIRYPDGAGAAAGRTVVAVDALPTDTTTAKERMLLDLLREELAEGRNAIVFAWHLDVVPRLARLLRTLGLVATLDANKVPPAKRDAWIAREITRKTRVLILNPVCVSTGVNSMVPYFSSVIWYENPACNPQIRRQANGRIRRIGQREEARFYSLVYENSAQAIAHRLLLHKAGIGEATDGLDATAALQAAGVGAVDLTVARDLGRALFEALTAEEPPRLAA
jgi:hypothetical protein